MDVYLSCMLRVYGCVFCSIFLLFVYLLMPMSSNPSPVIRWGLRNSKKKESGADQLVDHTTDLPKAKSNQCNLSQRPGTALRTTLRFTWSALVCQTGRSPKRTAQGDITRAIVKFVYRHSSGGWLVGSWRKVLLFLTRNFSYRRPISWYKV